ncbi:MAG: hypothetical protein AAF141_01730 [Pseudomonadota bacterium]
MSVHPIPAPASQDDPAIKGSRSVKDRAAAQSTAMTDEQQAAVRSLANDLHRLNASVMKAVEAGISVELMRSARHHGGEGAWGDLLTPVIIR